MLDDFTERQPRENLKFLIHPFRWNKHHQGPSKRFLRSVAEQLLCSRVPTADDAIERLADDGIVRRLDYGGELRLRYTIALPLGYVGGNTAHRIRSASRIEQWELDRQVGTRAVG